VLAALQGSGITIANFSGVGNGQLTFVPAPGSPPLQPALLKKRKQAGAKANEKGGVSYKNQKNVRRQPSFVRNVLGEKYGLFIDGGHEGQKKHHWKNHHAG